MYFVPHCKLVTRINLLFPNVLVVCQLEIHCFKNKICNFLDVVHAVILLLPPGISRIVRFTTVIRE